MAESGMAGTDEAAERPDREGRIVVGVSGSLGSIAALHHAVAEARRTDVEVLAVLCWTSAGEELGYRRTPARPPSPPAATPPSRDCAKPSTRRSPAATPEPGCAARRSAATPDTVWSAAPTTPTTC